jgi:RNA polymerase sigma-70 factor (ECF subfamily)
MGREEGLRREALLHADSLHNLAYYLTGTAADAEDLVQETYARAFAALDRFAPGGDLKAWLARILRNAHVDGWRRKRADPTDRDVDVDAVPEAGADEPLRGDAELERMRGVVARELEQAVMGLPADSRLLIALDAEGLSEAELAQVFGCAPGTIKSRLHRARAALRQALAGYAR